MLRYRETVTETFVLVYSKLHDFNRSTESIVSLVIRVQPTKDNDDIPLRDWWI